MTGVDWIIVGLLLLLALFGWAQGFVTGALALIGFALGAWLGTRLAGLVLPDGSRNPYAPAIGLVGALIVGAGFAAGFEGLGVRAALEADFARLRLRRRRPRRAADRAAWGSAWCGSSARSRSTPTATSATRSSARRSCRGSTRRCRRPGPLLNALARFDPFPRIDGPEANVAPPAKGIGRDPQVRGGRGQRGEDPRDGVRARRRGLGLGGARRRRRHQRARGGGPDRHQGAAARPRAAARRDRDRVRPAQRPRGAAGAGAAGARRCRSPTRRGRASRPRSSASRRTGPTTCAPAGSAPRARR